MTDRLCTKCDGRGFHRNENAGIVTALTNIKHCTDCKGYGRISDFNYMWIIVPIVAVVVSAFLALIR